MKRRGITSGGPWEDAAGYSRALVVGDTCVVSGTTDAGPDGRSRHPGDVAAQTRSIFDIVRGTLEQAGFSIADVIRTRMFVTDISRAPDVLAVHREMFGDVRPAATIVQVVALVDPSLLIEIEVDAVR